MTTAVVNSSSTMLESLIRSGLVVGIFHPDSVVALMRDPRHRLRVIVNSAFLAAEIGGCLTNLYLLLRLLALARSVRHLRRSHWRALLCYGRYTRLCTGLCLHLAAAGLLTCGLSLAAHLRLCAAVLYAASDRGRMQARRNQQQQQRQDTANSIFSCHYIPFLRDALCNVCVYLTLLVMVIYRRADISSISQRIRSSNGCGAKTRLHSQLAARRHKARLVLLHSLPWVLSLGLALPRGLLDMRYDFRRASVDRQLESPLAQELCVQQSKDNDLVNLTMWSLQAWMPLVLTTGLIVAYSLRDRAGNRGRGARSRRAGARNRGTASGGGGAGGASKPPGSRRNSTLTLGGPIRAGADDDAGHNKNMYSSSRTLYSLHNYKEEVIKLVQSSPILFYAVLLTTLLLKLPHNSAILLDTGYYLWRSRFMVSKLVLVCLKIGDQLHLALLPLLVLQGVIMLFRNSLRIYEIRTKVRQLAENDDSLLRSTLNVSGGTGSRANHSQQQQQRLMLLDSGVGSTSHHSLGRRGAPGGSQHRLMMDDASLHRHHRLTDDDDEDEDDYDDSERPFMLSTV